MEFAYIAGGFLLGRAWAFAVSVPLRSSRLAPQFQLIIYVCVAVVTGVAIAMIESPATFAAGSSVALSMGLLAGFVSCRPFVIVAEQTSGEASSPHAIARIIAAPFLVLAATLAGYVSGRLKSYV